MNTIITLVLAHIAFAESSLRPVGMHPDGQSYGYFGLTEAACAEVGEAFPPATKEDELRCAAKYLELMDKRHKCEGNFWRAAQFYHGGSEEAREEYGRKLARINACDAVNMFYEVFPEINPTVTKLTDEIARGYVEAQSPCLEPYEFEAKIAKLENRVLQLNDAIRELKVKIQNRRREQNEN